MRSQIIHVSITWTKYLPIWTPRHHTNPSIHDKTNAIDKGGSWPKHILMIMNQLRLRRQVLENLGSMQSNKNNYLRMLLKFVGAWLLKISRVAHRHTIQFQKLLTRHIIAKESWHWGNKEDQSINWWIGSTYFKVFWELVPNIWKLCQLY